MTLESAFVAHHRYVWAVCYRMTGSATDADDLVQETFSRALERPPADDTRPIRPWLTKVAVNLSRDALKKRRRKKYGGDWLPAPIDVLEHEPPAHEVVTTEARYDLMESVSLAFLVALEELTPSARAVLLLRDVFDYSVIETAEALHMSVPNVKTTLHRARRSMAAYDADRIVPSEGLVETARTALMQFLTKLAEGDVGEIELLLSRDVIARSDGGGRYHAANKPVVGANKVARFLVNLAHLRGPPTQVAFQTLNGTAALHARFTERPNQATEVTMIFEVDRPGKIRRIYSQLVEEKRTAVRFE